MKIFSARTMSLVSWLMRYTGHVTNMRVNPRGLGVEFVIPDGENKAGIILVERGQLQSL